MTSNFLRKTYRNSARFLGIGLLSLGLVSCGGGGGSGGAAAGSGSGGSTSTPTSTLTLVSPTSSSATLGAYASTTIQVSVASGGKAVTTPVSVTFTSPCASDGKATLTASATTNNGVAEAVYTDKGCGSSDVITIGTTGATSLSLVLNVTAPSAASIAFVSASPSGESIVIAGAGGNGRVETATLTFKVLDTAGNPLSNQAVGFTVNPANLVSLGTTSAVSDASGQVVATVSSQSNPTTFRVIATLTGSKLTPQPSTESDTISVTTGQTNPESLSISVVTYNIAGWEYDNNTTAVNILLADDFGNPVADGTAIVLETDSGAIGSSTNGGCVTANGACSVTFRSQNPRYGIGNTAGKRAGMATIQVSTTNSTTTIKGETGIFLSDDYVATPIVSSTSNTVTTPAKSGLDGYVVDVASCAQSSFDIQLNDLNNNPLPAASGIATAAVVIGTDPTTKANNPAIGIGSIFPAAVPNIGPGNVTNVAAMPTYLGSSHNIGFTPGANCKAGGTLPANNADGSFGADGKILITTTSPAGKQTRIPVYIRYPQ